MDYSPDGRYIAIYLYDFLYLDNIGRRILIIDTTGHMDIRSINFTDRCHMHFSSDSQNLFVITCDYHYKNMWKLYSINCIDPKQDTVSEFNNFYNWPSYKEDHWCNNKDNSLHAYGQTNLIVIDSNSKTILDTSQEYSIRCICFSPKNKHIAFVRDNLYIIDINIKHKKMINLINIRNPQYICYSPDGAQIAIANCYRCEIYDVDSRQLIQLHNYKAESTVLGLFLMFLDGDQQ